MPNSWRPRAWAILQRTEAATRVASLINMLVFLRHGVYRQVRQRVSHTGETSDARYMSWVAVPLVIFYQSADLCRGRMLCAGLRCRPHCSKHKSSRCMLGQGSARCR